MPYRWSSLDWFDVALLGAGLIILAFWFTDWARRRWRDPLIGSPIRANSLSPVLVWLCMVGYFFGAALGSLIAKWWVPDSLPEHAKEAWQGVFMSVTTQTITVAVCLLVARFSFVNGLRGLGLTGCRFLRELPWAMGGWLVALYVCEFCAWYTTWLTDMIRPDYEPPSHAVFTMLQSSEAMPLMRILAIASAVVVAPIGEEIFFRGILQTAIHRVLPPKARSLRHRWLAIIVTATLFAIMHLQTPQFLPALLLLGIILGYLYEKRGTLIAPIVVHIFFNSKSLVWYFAHSYWGC